MRRAAARSGGLGGHAVDAAVVIDAGPMLLEGFGRETLALDVAKGRLAIADMLQGKVYDGC